MLTKSGNHRLSWLPASTIEEIHHQVSLAVALLLQPRSGKNISVALKLFELDNLEPVLVARNSLGEHSLLLTKRKLIESQDEDMCIVQPTHRGESDFFTPKGHYSLAKSFQIWQRFKKMVLEPLIPRHRHFYSGFINKAIVLIDSSLDSEMVENMYPTSLNESDSSFNLNSSDDSIVGYKLGFGTVSKLGKVLADSSCEKAYRVKRKKIKLSKNYEQRALETCIEDFRRHLVLLPCQPNQSELYNSLEELLDSWPRQAGNTADDHRDRIFLKIVNWFLFSNGSYHTRNDLLALIGTELDRIEARSAWIARMAHDCNSHLKSLCLQFEDDAISELRKAIFSTDINSIIHVKPPNSASSMLTAVKVNQALHECGEVKDLSIAISGEALDNFVLFHDEEDIFSYLPRCFFFVVHCTRQLAEDTLNRLMVAFYQRVAESERLFPMKLILMAPDISSVDACIPIVRILDSPVSWSHLTAQCREYQFKKPFLYNGYFSDLLTLTDGKVREPEWLEQALLEEYLTRPKPEVLPILPAVSNKGNCLVQRRLRRFVEIDSRALLSATLSTRFCYSSADFELLCRNYPNENIHHLVRLDDGVSDRLFWRQTRGSIRELRPFVIKSSCSVYSANEADPLGSEEIEVESWIKDRGSKVCIVLVNREADQSALFESLATKRINLANEIELPSWLIFIDLSEQSDKLNSLVKSPEFCRANALDTLINRLIVWPDNSQLVKELFKCRLLNPGGRILLVFTGFEKLNFDCWNKIIALIETLEHMPGIERLFIFHKPDEYFSGDLEDRLNQYAYFLPDLSQTEKVDYLVHYWRLKLGEETHLEAESAVFKYAEKVVSALSPSSTLGKYEIRSHVIYRLLAEIALDSVRKIIESGTVDDADCVLKPTDIASIFDILWKVKLDWLRKSLNCETGAAILFIDTLKAICQRLAIQTVLPAKAGVFWQRDNFFRLVGKPVLNQCARVMAQLGMFCDVDSDRFQFIDRAVADFFVAQYWCDCLQQEECLAFSSAPAQDVIFKCLLVKSEYLGVRSFFNSLVEPHIKGLKFGAKLSERNPVVMQSALNDRLVSTILANHSSSSGCHAIFEQTVRDGHANLLSWLLFCAHSSLLVCQTNGTVSGDSMYCVFSVHNAAFLISVADSSEAGYEIVKRVLAWFEMANATYLKQLIDAVCLDVFCCHPGAVIDLIAANRANLDEQYILDLLFGTANDSNCYLTRLIERGGSLKTSYLQEAVTRFSAAFSPAIDQMKCRLFEWFQKLEPNAVYCEAVPSFVKHVVENMDLDALMLRQFVSHAIKMCPSLLEKLQWHMPTYPSDVRTALAERGYEGLNHVQRAILLGQPTTVRQVLNDVRWLRSRQSPDAAHLIASVSHDDFFLTPFYISVVRGHFEISELLMDFFNDVLTADDLTLLLTESQGCLFRSLFDSIMRQDEDAALGALNVIEKKLCSRALFNLLMRGPDGSRRRTLLVKALELECFRVARKVVGIVLKRLGQQGLTDLVREEGIFYVIHSLVECNQSETLERILDSLMACKGDSFLAHHLLRGDDLKRGGIDDLEALTDILSVLKNQVVRGYIPQRLRSSALSHLIHLLTTIVLIKDERSLANENKLVCTEKATTTKTSIWTLYCTREIDCDHVDAILKSVSNEPCLGEATVNELGLHNLAHDGKPLLVLLREIKASEMVGAFERHSPRLRCLSPEAEHFAVTDIDCPKNAINICPV